MITNSKETMNIDLDEVKLPKKVDPCPILQAIVELRFDSTLPNDAIFGIIYKEFQDDYPNVEELPILQLPEIVRKQDPNLLYKPNYRLSKNEEFVFQVGAKMVSLAINKPYTGWQLFSEKLHNHIERVDSLNLSNSYSRIGIRYINGFDCNMFEKINLSVDMGSQSLMHFDTSMRSNIPTGHFTSALNIVNYAQVTKTTTEVCKGSIIDIDTFQENPTGDINDLLEAGHVEEKKLFFTLLKQDFVKQELNPEY